MRNRLPRPSSVLLGCSLAALAACSGGGFPEAGAPLPAEIAGNAGIQAWLAVWQQTEPALTVESFSFEKAEPIEAQYVADPTGEDMQAEARGRYVYAPGGALFIDVRAHEGEPDSSVRLFNRNGDGRIETVAFCGTPCSFDAALWLDENRAVVVGQTESLDENGSPSCSNARDGWSCDRRLTIDVYDLASGEKGRYVSSAHRFPAHAFSGR